MLPKRSAFPPPLMTSEPGSFARKTIVERKPQILREVSQAHPYPPEIQSELRIPASTLSHHISRLVWAGLVEQEREGRVLRCRPRFAALRALVDFLYQECCQADEIPARRSPAKRQGRTS